MYSVVLGRAKSSWSREARTEGSSAFSSVCRVPNESLRKIFRSTIGINALYYCRCPSVESSATSLAASSKWVR